MPAILIAGPEDDFQVALDAKRAWEAMTEGLEDDMAKEVVDGQAGVIDEVETAMARFLSAVRTMPMFSDRKVVWLRNISFLGDNRVGKTEAALKAAEQLVAIVEKLDPSVSVLLSASPYDSRRRAQKALLDRCQSTLHKKGKDNQGVVDMLQREAKGIGLSFAGHAAEIMAEKTGGNGRLALTELEKVATYLGTTGKRITEAHVAELVVDANEGGFYEPVLAFHSGQIVPALESLRRYFFAGRDARALLSMLQKRNGQLIQLRALVDAGQIGGGRQVSLDRAKQTFGSYFGDTTAGSVLDMQAWQAGQAVRDAQNFSLKQLLRIQQAMLDTFQNLSSASKDEQEGVMRTLFLDCLS